MRQLGYFILLIAAFLITLQLTDSLALPHNKESESGSHENPEVSTALSNEDRSSNDGDDEPIQMVTHQPGATVPLLISMTATTERHFEEDSKEVPDKLETDNKTVVQDEQSSREVSDPVAVEPQIQPEVFQHQQPEIKNFHADRENLSVEVMDHPPVVTVKPQRINQVARNGPIIRPSNPENSAFFVERIVEEVRDLVPPVTAAPTSKRVVQTPRATATPKVQQTHVRKAIPLNRFVSKNRDDISLEVDVTATSSTAKPVITRDQSTIRAGRVRTAFSAITTAAKTSEERISARVTDIKVTNTKPSIKQQVVRTTTASTKRIRRPISRQPINDTTVRDRVTPPAKHAITTQVVRNQSTPTTKTSRPVGRPKPASRAEIFKPSNEGVSSSERGIPFSAVKLNNKPVTQVVLTTPATTTQPTLALAVNPAATITIVTMTTPATAVKPAVTPARQIAPAITSRLINHRKPVLPKHSSGQGNVSLETKDRIRTTQAPKQIVRTQPTRITRIFSTLAVPTVAKKISNHSNEDVSMETSLNRTETAGDAVHSERTDDKISKLEVGNRVVVETTSKATTQPTVPTPTTTQIIPKSNEENKEEEVASVEDAVKQDEEDETAKLDAVHSSESAGTDLSTQMRERVAPITSSKPVTQTPESLEDVNEERGEHNETETEAGIQSNEQEEDASLEASHNKTETAPDASHSNENEDDDDDDDVDVSVEVGDKLVGTSPATIEPAVIVTTEAVSLSLLSNEDESFPVEIMDRVLHRVVQNQTTNTTHRFDDVKDHGPTQIFKPIVQTQTEPIRVVPTQSGVVQKVPQMNLTTKIVPAQSTVVQQAPQMNVATVSAPTQSTAVFQQAKQMNATTEIGPPRLKVVQQVVTKAQVAPTVASNASNEPNISKHFDKQKDLIHFSSELTDGVAVTFVFNQTTAAPTASLPFAEDLSFEVIDGVLYQEVRNDPTLNDSHIIWEQADDHNLSLEVKDDVVYNETTIPFPTDAEPAFIQTTIASNHSDERDDNSTPVEDDGLVVNSAIQSPTMIEGKPDERPGSVTIELADEEIRPLVRNRSSSHGTHHSDDEREDEFPLESVDGKRPASSSHGIHQSPHPAQDEFSLELGKRLNTQNQTDTVTVSSGSADDQDRILKQVAQPTTATDRNSGKHDSVSLEANGDQQNTSTTLQPDDLSLKDKGIASNPIDNNHQTIEETTVATTASHKQQRLLKKLANGVLDQLFSSDVDEEIRKQVHQFSLQALDSLRMADSHSATASTFSERRAAGSSNRNSNYLPLLIACLLFVFS